MCDQAAPHIISADNDTMQWQKSQYTAKAIKATGVSHTVTHKLLLE